MTNVNLEDTSCYQERLVNPLLALPDGAAACNYPSEAELAPRVSAVWPSAVRTGPIFMNRFRYRDETRSRSVQTYEP